MSQSGHPPCGSAHMHMLQSSMPTRMCLCRLEGYHSCARNYADAGEWSSRCVRFVKGSAAFFASCKLNSRSVTSTSERIISIPCSRDIHDVRMNRDATDSNNTKKSVSTWYIRYEQPQWLRPSRPTERNVTNYAPRRTVFVGLARRRPEFMSRPSKARANLLSVDESQNEVADHTSPELVTVEGACNELAVGGQRHSLDAEFQGSRVDRRGAAVPSGSTDTSS